MFAATRIDRPSKPLSLLDAEQLASLCARHGEDWFEAAGTMDIKAAAGVADDVLFGQLDEEFREFVEDVKRRNEDRADLQVRNLGQHLANQQRKLGEIRQRHIIAGRDSLAKATQGRVEAMRGRVERQRLKIEERRRTTQRSDEVIVALVRIYKD